MAMITLRDAIEGTARVSYTRKPELRARVCDACKCVFAMEAPHGRTFGRLEGIFDCTAEDADGRRMGNIFRADVCSFACAQALYDGGWKAMDVYAAYAAVQARVAYVSLSIGPVRTAHDLIAEWEARGEQEPPTEIHPLFIGGSFGIGSLP